MILVIPEKSNADFCFPTFFKPSAIPFINSLNTLNMLALSTPANPAID